MSSFVSVARSASIARITLDRPAKRNALNRQFLHELLEAISAARNDPTTRMLVLGAAGSVFCAGMDLSEMQSRASLSSSAEEWERDSQDYASILHMLFEAPFPTLAAVPGPAVAGGVGLAAACDLVIASEIATFSLPEPMRGIVAAMVTPFLVHRVGFGPAAQLLLSGETCSAASARQIGLCYDVVAADRLDERVDQMTVAIGKCAPEALAQTKAFLHRCMPVSMAEQLRQATQVSATARESSAAREGLQAFLEKRTPRWQHD